MSLVENLINQISTNGLGGITRPQNFDLEDDTFAKLLEKQMSNTEKYIDQSNSLGGMGIPAGLVIESYDATNFSEKVQDQMEISGIKNQQETTLVEPIEIKDVDMRDYFSTLLSSSNENSNFMNFAKKQATNAYGIFKNSYVTDIKEFAQDLASMI